MSNEVVSTTSQSLKDAAQLVENETINIKEAAEQLGIAEVYLRTVLTQHEGSSISIHGRKFVTLEFMTSYSEMRQRRADEKAAKAAAKPAVAVKSSEVAADVPA